MSDGGATTPPANPGFPTFLPPEASPVAPGIETGSGPPAGWTATPPPGTPEPPSWLDATPWVPRTKAWSLTLVLFLLALASIPVGFAAAAAYADRHPDDEFAGLVELVWGFLAAIVLLFAACVAAVVTMSRQVALNRAHPGLRERRVVGVVVLAPLILTTILVLLYVGAATFSR